MNMTIVCRSCLLALPLDRFEHNRRKCKRCVSAYKLQWAHEHGKPPSKEKKYAYDKKYRETHKDYLAQKKKEYRNNNREKEKARVRWRFNNDPNFRMTIALRNRFRRVMERIKCNNYDNATATSQKLLGCSVEEFVHYMESQFSQGMTWHNYGTLWHVDHIKPCVAFDLTDYGQQKICFHYTNLRPLLAIDNLRKNKYIIAEATA